MGTHVSVVDVEVDVEVEVEVDDEDDDEVDDEDDDEVELEELDEVDVDDEEVGVGGPAVAVGAAELDGLPAARRKENELKQQGPWLCPPHFSFLAPLPKCPYLSQRALSASCSAPSLLS